MENGETTSEYPDSNSEARYAEAGAFDRSNGFVPWTELGNVLVALNSFGRAVLSSCSQYVQNVRENAPETEREILRLHASLLNTGADIVKNQLDALEQRMTQPAPAKNQTAARPFESRKIDVE
jgi:hypothetical protein